MLPWSEAKRTKVDQVVAVLSDAADELQNLRRLVCDLAQRVRAKHACEPGLPGVACGTCLLLARADEAVN